MTYNYEIMPHVKMIKNRNKNFIIAVRLTFIKKTMLIYNLHNKSGILFAVDKKLCNRKNVVY